MVTKADVQTFRNLNAETWQCIGMAQTFVLIAGRTSRQGTTLNESKFGSEYLEETQTLWMHVQDLAALGVEPGARVRVRSAWGQAEGDG